MSKNNTYFLETERLYFEKLQEHHVSETYLGWLHNPEINYYLETGKIPTSLNEIKQFVINNKAILFLAIFDKITKKHIGNIKIDQPLFIHNVAEYGILIGDKDYWGKGIAKEASIEVLNHCFKKLNIRKITLGFIAGNTSAQKLYESIGFIQEGILKNHVFCDGVYQDIIRMAIFQKDWIERK